MDWITTINDKLKEAMKAKDKVALAALRGIKKEFLEAQTAKGSDGTISDEAGLKILSKMVKQRNESAKIFEEQGRPELAEVELAEADVISQFLPKMLTEAEIEEAVKAIIASVGATSMKEMGKVMGMASKQLAGKADGGVISGIVRKLLS